VEGFLGAGGALVVLVVILVAILRQKTVKKLQSRLFIIAIMFLQGAIIANLLVALKVGSGDLGTILAAKKIQAQMDFLFGIATGAFLVVVAEPAINTAKDFFRYMKEKFPDSYLFYTGIMCVGVFGSPLVSIGIVATGPETFTLIIPQWWQLILLVITINVVSFIPLKLMGYLRRTKPSPSIVRKTYMIMAGLEGYTITEAVFEVVLSPLGSGLRSLGFLVQMTFIALVAVALRERTFLEDLLIPAPEADLKTVKRFHLDSGYAYIIPEEQARLSFEIFRDLVTHGAEGLCITRIEPSKVAAEYGLEKTPILWLSRVATVKNSLKPAPIENVAMAINHFLEAARESVILLDGLEYLVAHNKFPSVLSLLHDLVDKVAIHSAILLLPVNPTAWSEQELNLAKRDVRVVQPSQVRGLTRIPVGGSEISDGR
jgi:hypothetical protein